MSGFDFADKLIFTGLMALLSAFVTCGAGMATVEYDRVQRVLVGLVIAQATVGIGAVVAGFAAMIWR